MCYGFAVAVGGAKVVKTLLSRNVQTPSASKFLQFQSDFYDIEGPVARGCPSQLIGSAHPLCGCHAHALLEGRVECAIAAESALVGEALHRHRLSCLCGLAIEADKMAYAQAVDVGVVGCALRRKVLAEIYAVCPDERCELGHGDVVLQIELSLLAMLLEQWAYVPGHAERRCRAVAHGWLGLVALSVWRLAAGGVLARVGVLLPVIGVRLRVVACCECRVGGYGEVAQRLDAPQQIADECQVEQLQEVFVGRGIEVEGVDAQAREDEGQHEEALPQFLVLEVGIVVAQPTAVLLQRHHHIRYHAHGQRDETGVQDGEQGVAACGHAQGHDEHEWCDHHGNGPQRAAAILQHDNEYRQSQRADCHAVEQSSHEICQHLAIAVGEQQCGHVPRVAHGRCGQEGSRPPSQTRRRGHGWSDGVAPTQQQIEACCHVQRRHSAVEHIKDVVHQLLCEHDCMLLCEVACPDVQATGLVTRSSVGASDRCRTPRP